MGMDAPVDELAVINGFVFVHGQTRGIDLKKKGLLAGKRPVLGWLSGLNHHDLGRQRSDNLYLGIGSIR
jgi:hypothetical protein